MKYNKNIFTPILLVQIVQRNERDAFVWCMLANHGCCLHHSPGFRYWSHEQCLVFSIFPMCSGDTMSPPSLTQWHPTSAHQMQGGFCYILYIVLLCQFKNLSARCSTHFIHLSFGCILAKCSVKHRYINGAIAPESRSVPDRI